MKIKKENVMTMKKYLHYVIDNTEFAGIERVYDYNFDNSKNADVRIELYDKLNTTDLKINTFLMGGELMVGIIEEVEIDKYTPLEGLIEKTLINGKIYTRETPKVSIATILCDNSASGIGTSNILYRDENGDEIELWNWEKGMVE